MKKVYKCVAMLSTGDEIINGDIVDTNAPYFAQQFIDNGITPGGRISASDNQAEIEKAIHYLLEDHDALITIAGLGPTSDDRTRYALSEAIDTPLEFYDEVWQWITDMFNQKNLNIPETNRQQALFPKGSEPIYNRNGSAAASYIRHNNKDIFMLPGPPNECRPIFLDYVLPKLIEENYTKTEYRKSWLLLGVSESDIASKIQPFMKDSNCTLGFRVHYPYLEVKLRSEDKAALTSLSQRIVTVLKPKLVSESKKTASQQLISYLQHADKNLLIMDEATFGRLEATLSRPTLRDTIYFYHKKQKFDTRPIEIKIKGLEAYWKKHKDETIQMPLSIHITSGDKVYTIEKYIYNRGTQSIENAVEVICWELLHYL